MTYSVVTRPTRDRLGEGPIWVANRGELIWVDIMAPAVHRLDLVTGQIGSIAVDQPVGWALPIAGRKEFLVGMASGLWRVDLDDGSKEFLKAIEPDRPQNRLNDAKIDPCGRVWTGSKDDSDQQASGAFYRIDANLAHLRVDDDYGVTNGPTFSLDGKTLYHTDSAARTVFAFDLEQDGTIANKRVWLKFADEWGYPDGMTTDAEGCIWIAHWGGGMISRFGPDARRMATIPLPAPNITSCAFAGPDLDRLFVTSSTIDCEDEPLAGSLFEVEVDVRGLPAGEFRLTK